MKQSLGMDAGDAAKAPGQADGQNPQDVEMVVDSVADTDPVAQSVPSVQDQYPDCAFSDDLLYRVTLVNKLETNVKVEVTFSLIDDKVPVNLSYPTGGLVDFLKPGQTGTLVTLAKINPLGGPANMENLQIEVIHSVHGDNAFQMNSFASQSDIPSSTASKAQQSGSGSTSAVPSGIKDQRRNGVLLDSKPAQKTGDVGVGEENVHEPGKANAAAGTSYVANAMKEADYMLAAADDLPSEFPGQKACQICTFLNSEANKICEMCQSPFE